MKELKELELNLVKETTKYFNKNTIVSKFISCKVLMMALFFVSGCTTTDTLSINLLSERIRVLERSDKLSTDNSSNKLQTYPENDENDEKTEEIINALEDIKVKISDIKSQIVALNEAIEKERLLRIELEKIRNPREYKQYLEARKMFE